MNRESNADAERAELVPKELDIPRKPKPVKEPEEVELANGSDASHKRKREGEPDDELTNGHVAKKIAPETNGNSEIIDLDNEGAILIDD